MMREKRTRERECNPKRTINSNLLEAGLIANRIYIPLPFDCCVEGPVCRLICYNESLQWADAGLIHDACSGDMGGIYDKGAPESPHIIVKSQ